MVLGLFYAVILLLSSFRANARTDLKVKYPFSMNLMSDANRGYYNLHWNFTREESRIYFAVNVSTTGWVGFGLSPTGGMVNSDVVIGWVNNGAVYFKDRYADAQAIPKEDTSQDWCLTSAEETGGYTVLEFNRKFVTCDSRDRDISSDTARVVWSFFSNDPSVNNDANLLQHSQRGSASVNLLGGNPKQTPLGNDLFLDIRVSSAVIPPNPTTYWCESYRFPPAFINGTQYIHRAIPEISSHSQEFVHHFLVYVCPIDSPLSPSEVGESRSCQESSASIGHCRGSGSVIWGWAVGGDELVYPQGMAFPIGGNGQEQFLVMETHYDNPNLQSGVVDSSGLRFYYNTNEPEHRLGLIYLGVNVNRDTIIPPRTTKFTVTSVCSASCTNSYLPQDGITVIGNLLHTHLIGRTISLRHYRYNATTNQLVEMKPVDQNLDYNFNFQQFTLLSSPRVVKPGDFLVLQCTYDSTSRSSITFGGPSTRDEMCLTFPIYYPKTADGSSMIRCSSTPNISSLPEFYNYIVGQNITTEQAVQDDLLGVLDNLDWAGDPMLTPTFQRSLSTGRVSEDCIRENTSRDRFNVPIPQPDVIYRPPDVCNGVISGRLAPTCRRDGDEANVSGTLPVISARLLTSMVALALSLLLL